MRRRLVLPLVAVGLIFALLQVLGFRMLGSLADLVGYSMWTAVGALVVVGFVAGRLIEQAVRRRDVLRSQPRT